MMNIFFIIITSFVFLGSQGFDNLNIHPPDITVGFAVGYIQRTPAALFKKQIFSVRRNRRLVFIGIVAFSQSYRLGKFSILPSRNKKCFIPGEVVSGKIERTVGRGADQ